MKHARLADGTRIACLRVKEAQVLDRHVAGYLQHGVEIPPDGIVLDVGANVGVFGVRVAQRYPAARVYAFEPIPPIFEALQANVEVHGGGRIRPLNFGIGSQDAMFSFTYYPRSPALSTAHPEAWTANPDALVEAVRGSIVEAREHHWVARLVPLSMSGMLARYLSGVSEEYECRVRPLSDVLREEGIETVDLLKVDCEGAELEVLRGVGHDYWPRVRQVVAEVNDENGRLDTCVSLLKEQGFQDVVVDCEVGFEKTPLRNVFARRI